MSPPGRRLATLGLVLAGLATSALLLEAAVQLLVRNGAMATPRPAGARARFWDGNHPVFGVWHRPRARTAHTSPCFSAEYRTNSLGARDRERAPQATGRRGLVLGDSFVEGWGLPVEERLTNRLEQATGIEHLNFGMSHFGPYQSYLAYREFAPRFEHDFVLVGVVPHNDFLDLDFERASRSPAYLYRYRPYLVGEGPDYQHFDHREGALRGWLRRRSYAYHALDTVYRRITAGDGYDDYLARPVRDAEGRIHSYYHDYDERQLALLLHSLGRIADAAGERPVAVFVIPVHQDFLRHRQVGEGPLRGALEGFGAERGIHIVDLLPGMAEAARDPARYFFTCDYHWNDRGNEVAMRILQREVADWIHGPR